MALSGSCKTDTWYGSSTSGSLVFNWTATQNKSKNQSIISWNIKGSVSYGSIIFSELSVRINGESVYYRDSSHHTSTSNGTLLADGTVTLTHDADGECSFSVDIGAGIYEWSINKTGSDSFVLNTISVYRLSISAGEGSKIAVNRTSSGYGITGTLTDKSRLYYGDILKITFAPDENYSINVHTVNNSTFPSGNSHTVSGNVSVTSTASPINSLISATDGNIGSTSVILITRYNPSYTHTVTYEFGSLSGVIVTRESNTSIAWSIPTSFFEQIPNEKSGTCTLTCITYNGDTSIGSSTCTLVVTASPDSCSPAVSGTVVDTNTSTVALTGNPETIVRYKSTAACTISATARNSATITSKTVNGRDVTNDVLSLNNVDSTLYVFKAVDTRGYSSTYSVSPSVVAYIPLTCNPILSRTSASGNEVTMELSGNYYRGSFGAYNNTLVIRYRYRKTTETTWSSWVSIPSTSYSIGTNSYSTNSAITLDGEFDYRYSYLFHIQAYDGANGIMLSTVNQEITLQRGVPIFDWGERDFEFHVPVTSPSSSITLTGEAGAIGYVRIANVKIIDSNINSPIVFELCRMGSENIFLLTVLFCDSAGSDPAISVLTATNGLSAFAYKTATSTWDLYVAKGCAEDEIAVLGLKYNIDYLRDRLKINCNMDGYINSVPEDAIIATTEPEEPSVLPISSGGTEATTAEEALSNLGGLPRSGGTMVASGSANGRITIPGLYSGWIGARDKAGIIVTNGGDYTPAISMKSANCTWDIATYSNNLEITKFSDINYNAGSNVPTKEFTFREDGIAGLQSTKLLANGSLSSGSSLSGTGNLALYRTIYILFGESLNGANQYYSFTCPFVADQWGIYLPSAGDYYRAKVVISSAGQVTVSMLSSVTRFCFIYACL